MSARKNQLKKVFGALAVAAAVVIGFQNCDQSRLALMTELASAKSDGEICAIEPTQIDSFTKVMFVIDKSGSNSTTDPGSMYRTNTITSFYQLHQANVNVKWGLIAFQGTGSTAYITAMGAGAGTAGYSNDPAVVMAAIGQIAGGDTGGTPFQSAIGAVRSAISFDLNSNRSELSNYIVVFISDGEPTDYGGDEMAIDNDIRDLLTISDVTFSTVYYGPASNAASSRMERMARVGQGRFLDTNVSGRIPLDNLIGFKSGEPWLIKNLTVTNLNAAPCDDGTVDADSDADGLCDKDEIRYNTEFQSDPVKWQRMAGKTFDPANRNSFDPYISDAIQYKAIVFGEQLPRDCTVDDLVDEDRDLASACEERYLYSASPAGPTQTWTTAMQKDGDAFNFDSDGDGFLDWFEFVMTRNKSSAMDRNNVSQLYNGFRLDTIYQKHLNWRNPFSSREYDGVFQFRRVNERGQNCYSYKQTVLPLYPTRAVTSTQVSGKTMLAHAANENVVMISFIQSPEKDPNGPGELRYTFQKISAASSYINLNLRVEEYQSYRVGPSARVK